MTQPAKTDALEVLDRDLAAHGDRATSYHAASHKSFGDHIGYAFLTGLELAALREKAIEKGLFNNNANGGGAWEKIRSAYCPNIPERSSQRYLQFYKAMGTCATVAQVSPGKLLVGGELSETGRERVLKAVHKAMDGKTLTQFYRDLALIREKERQKHTPAKPVSAEDQTAAQREQGKRLAEGFVAAAQTLLDFNDADKALMPRSHWLAVRDAAVSASKLARTWLRNSKRQKKGTK